MTEGSAEGKQTKAREPEADKGMEQRKQRIPRQGEKRERRETEKGQRADLHMTGLSL